MIFFNKIICSDLDDFLFFFCSVSFVCHSYFFTLLFFILYSFWRVFFC